MLDVMLRRPLIAVSTGLTLLLSPIAQATTSGPSVTGFTVNKRNASIDGVSASLSVNVFPDGRAAVGVTFANTSASRYPVGCLNAYKDLRYELRDPGGQVVPENSATLSHPPIDFPGVRIHVISQNYRHGAVDCHAVPTRLNDRGANLQALYPHLRRGTYTLRVMFAPTEMNGASAAMDPVPINVPADF
jgi:hypothetical protein